MKTFESSEQQPLPIEVGAYEAANHDLDEALKNDPEFIEKRFMAIFRSNPELGRSLLNSNYNAALEQQPERIFARTVVMLFDALDKTRVGKEMESDFDITTAA